MDGEFWKEIYNRRKLNNKYLKQPKEEHKIVYEKQKEKRIRISRKIIKIYMNTVSSKNIETNKGFLNK